MKRTSPTTTFENPVKPPSFNRRIDLTEIQSFRPHCYVLFLHVSRLYPYKADPQGRIVFEAIRGLARQMIGNQLASAAVV
jgi:hypothetical protein